MFFKKIYSFMYSYYSYWMLFLLKNWEKLKKLLFFHFISFSAPPYCTKALLICLENGFSHSIPSMFHVSKSRDIRTSPFWSFNITWAILLISDTGFCGLFFPPKVMPHHACVTCPIIRLTVNTTVKGQHWRWLIYALNNVLLHNMFPEATTTVL